LISLNWWLSFSMLCTCVLFTLLHTMIGAWSSLKLLESFNIILFTEFTYFGICILSCFF
jgi:hypothetical protein